MRPPTNVRAPPAGTSAAPSDPAFESFYRAQRLVPPDEWPAFLEALETPLPLDLRVSREAQMADRAWSELQDRLPPGSRPRSLSWVPGGRSFQLPNAAGSYQKFLHAQQKRGALQRQECASMVPALLLAPKPHHAVLDLCAAPGSKSCQLLEMMGDDREGGGGFLVANDASLGRAISLNHRLQSPNVCSPRTIVTSVDGRWWPSLFGLRFDRVLVDVPCSGDGMRRKRHANTPPWRASRALELHATQLRLLREGLRALRPGGRLVYSTCSLNPIENEAVVAAALRTYLGTGSSGGSGGGIELEEPRTLVAGGLAGLELSPGLITWTVDAPSADGDCDGDTDADADADAATDDASGANTPQPSSVHPPAPDEAEGWLGEQLALTARLLPHRAASGGFFIASFRKAADPAEATAAEEEAKAAAEATAAAAEAAEAAEATAEAEVAAEVDAAEAAARVDVDEEDDELLEPLLLRGEEEWRQIAAFYGVTDAAVPRGTTLLWAPRRASRRAKLYLASDGAANAVLRHWQPAQRVSSGRRAGGGLRGRLHHVGLKAFEKLKLRNLANADAFPCEWRLCQPALPAALRYVRRRVLRTPSERLFAAALSSGSLDCDALLSLDGADTCVDADGKLVPGGAVLCLTAPPAATGPVDDVAQRRDVAEAGPSQEALACVAAVIMPGAGGLTVYAPKQERQGMLALLDAEAS